MYLLKFALTIIYDISYLCNTVLALKGLYVCKPQSSCVVTVSDINDFCFPLFFFLLCIGYSGGSSGTGAVILDDCNFHESVHMDNFDVDRTLSLVRL